jgi:hypothetical protein
VQAQAKACGYKKLLLEGNSVSFVIRGGAQNLAFSEKFSQAVIQNSVPQKQWAGRIQPIVFPDYRDPT